MNKFNTLFAFLFISYTYSSSGIDASHFSIDTTIGDVTLVTDVAATTSVTLSGESITGTPAQTAPTIASVSVANGTYKVGDTVAITITATNNETGLTLSTAIFNGQTLTNIIDNGDGTYSATYTVVEGDSDVADGGSVATNLAFTDAGNTGAATTSVTLSGESIDANTPSAPTIALATDTGSSNSDGITTDATVNVSNLENGATWEYSTDGGANWIHGGTASGTTTASFELAGGGGVNHHGILAGSLADPPTISATSISDFPSLSTHANDAPDVFFLDITTPTSTAKEVLFESGGSSLGITAFREGTALKIAMAENGNVDLTAPGLLQDGKRYAVIVEIASTNKALKVYVEEKDGTLPNSFGNPDKIQNNTWQGSWSGTNNGGWGKVGDGSAHGGSYSSFSGTFHEGRFYSGDNLSDIWTDGGFDGNVIVRQSDANDNTSDESSALEVTVDVVSPSVTGTRNGLIYNSGGNAEWTTRYSEDMALPTIAQFLATKALRVGSSTNIVTESSGELLGISYGQTNGAEDRKKLVFEIDVPEGDSDYLMRMQYGTTGHDNSGVTDLAGNALPQGIGNANNGRLDTTNMPPAINSDNSFSVAESAAVGGAIFTVQASDGNAGDTLTYALTNDASGVFSIDSTTGEITLASALDYETTTSYTIEVTVTDTDNGGTPKSASQTITVSVTDVDEVPPAITSGTTATIVENSGVSQVVYTIVATDNVGVTSYGLSGTDASDFSINTTNGKVTLTIDPDYETKNSYSFDVTASDAAGNTSAAITVTLTVTNVGDEAPPSVDATELSTSDTITLTMSETVVDDSATANDFTVSGGDNSPTVSSVAVSGATLTLTLSEDLSFTDGATITLSYTQSSGYIKDDAGNALADFSNLSVNVGTFSSEVPEIFSLEYTNPVRNSVEIRSSQLMRGLSIYNLSGQKVYTAKLNRHSTRVELSHLSQGIYLMRVFTNDAEKMLKLIKL